MSDIMKKEYTRRGFVGRLGGLAVVTMVDGVMVLSPDAAFAMVASSTGYILVDTKKCAGCTTCMQMCSMVHHGNVNLSSARIQVVTNPYAPYPEGIVQNQCHQCVNPPCVAVCPTGALHVDAAHGNVRSIDATKCDGCQLCIDACAFSPARPIWDTTTSKCEKCDLCSDTPYWTKTGGPGGQQACIEMCPMKAISYTTTIPEQTETGYQANLRAADVWGLLGFPTMDDGSFAPPADTSAPTTSSNAVGAYVGAAAITLSAVDNPGGSGVAHTYYRLNGAAQIEGTSVSVGSPGSFNLEFWSVDNVGTEETPHKMVSFTVAKPEDVATTVTITRSTATTTLPKPFVLQGVLTPGHVGDPVGVEVKKPGSGRWSYSSARLCYEVSGDGAKWWYRYTPKLRGTYYFRARFAAVDGRKASVSSTVNVTVR